MKKKASPTSFTLSSMLTIIAIVGILSCILFPQVAKPNDSNRENEEIPHSSYITAYGAYLTDIQVDSIRLKIINQKSHKSDIKLVSNTVK